MIVYSNHLSDSYHFCLLHELHCTVHSDDKKNEELCMSAHLLPIVIHTTFPDQVPHCDLYGGLPGPWSRRCEHHPVGSAGHG